MFGILVAPQKLQNKVSTSRKNERYPGSFLISPSFTPFRIMEAVLEVMEDLTDNGWVEETENGTISTHHKV